MIERVKGIIKYISDLNNKAINKQLNFIRDSS